jgi:hypothetical protein
MLILQSNVINRIEICQNRPFFQYFKHLKRPVQKLTAVISTNCMRSSIGQNTKNHAIKSQLTNLVCKSGVLGFDTAALRLTQPPNAAKTGFDPSTAGLAYFLENLHCGLTKLTRNSYCPSSAALCSRLKIRNPRQEEQVQKTLSLIEKGLR